MTEPSRIEYTAIHAVEVASLYLRQHEISRVLLAGLRRPKCFVVAGEVQAGEQLAHALLNIADQVLATENISSL